MSRKDDGGNDGLFFQMDRFVQLNGEWFYSTREGEEKGPFDSRSDALGDLITYIQILRKKESYGA